MADGIIDSTKPASSGISLPTALTQIRTNFAQAALHISDREVAHGIDSILSRLDAIVSEIEAARGSTNGMSQRLNISLNQDGTMKVPITQNNLSEWVDLETQPVYVSDYSFYLAGADYTSIFVPYRKIILNTAISQVYTMTVGSTYDSGTGNTTVTVYDGVVPAAPTDVHYGFVTPSASGSLDMRTITPTWLLFYDAGGF